MVPFQHGEVVGRGEGHEWAEGGSHNPTWCDLCGELIWGLYDTGTVPYLTVQVNGHGTGFSGHGIGFSGHGTGFSGHGTIGFSGQIGHGTCFSGHGSGFSGHGTGFSGHGTGFSG